MEGKTISKVVGVVVVCVGIHLGLATIAGLIIFGCGLGFLFLP